MTRGESVLMPIVDQVALRRSLKSELRQYLDLFPIHSLVGAPVMVDDTVRGVLALTRDHAGHPYTADDERLVRRIADRLGPLVRTADEISEAWRVRRELADLACCRGEPPATGATVHRRRAPRAALRAGDAGWRLDPALRRLRARRDGAHGQSGVRARLHLPPRPRRGDRAARRGPTGAQGDRSRCLRTAPFR